MEERFAAEEADVANIAAMEDVERGGKLIGIDPAEVFARNFASGEVAEIARSIASAGDGDVAERGPALRDKAQCVPGLG